MVVSLVLSFWVVVCMLTTLFLCPSICGLKKMLDICVDEFTGLNLKLNVKKSCILRFGAQYVRHSKELTLDGGVIEFVDKAKCLGIMLKVGRNFDVDVQYTKSIFINSFHELMQSCGVCRPSVKILHKSLLLPDKWQMAGSPPNLHTMVSRLVCAEDVLNLKVDVKLHAIRALTGI